MKKKIYDRKFLEIFRKEDRPSWGKALIFTFIQGIIFYVLGLGIFYYLGEISFFYSHDWITIIIIAVMLIEFANIWLYNEIKDTYNIIAYMRNYIRYDEVDHHKGNIKDRNFLNRIIGESKIFEILWLTSGAMVLDGYIILTYLKVLPIQTIVYIDIYEKLPALFFFLIIATIGGFSFGYDVLLLIRHLSNVYGLTHGKKCYGYINPPESFKVKHFWEYTERLQENIADLEKMSKIALFFAIIGLGLAGLSVFTLVTILPAIDFYTISFLVVSIVGLLSFYAMVEYQVHRVILNTKKRFHDYVKKLNIDDETAYHQLILINMYMKNFEEWTIDIAIIVEIIVAAFMPILGAYLALIMK